MPLPPPPLSDPNIESTASDIVYQHIRNGIVTGALEENESIGQDSVARMFDISKVPVREALKRLEAEGLVSFQKNKGAIVTSISEPELADIFEVRAILESNAIRLAVSNMSTATIEKAIRHCEAFSQETDVARWAELNWAFHLCLYKDANNDFLISQIQAINDRIERYLRIQLSLSHGQPTADQEHREILQACINGEAGRAAELVRQHIVGAHSSLKQEISQAPK